MATGVAVSVSTSEPEFERTEGEIRGTDPEEENTAHTGSVSVPGSVSGSVPGSVSGSVSGSVPGSVSGPQHRLARFPLSRIKALMKADPDLNLASQESVFIIAKATELFVEMIAKDALVYAQQGKRKTLQRKDLDNAIEAADEFAFLEGTLD